MQRRGQRNGSVIKEIYFTLVWFPEPTQRPTTIWNCNSRLPDRHLFWALWARPTCSMHTHMRANTYLMKKHYNHLAYIQRACHPTCLVLFIATLFTLMGKGNNLIIFQEMNGLGKCVTCTLWNNIHLQTEVKLGMELENITLSDKTQIQKVI